MVTVRRRPPSIGAAFPPPRLPRPWLWRVVSTLRVNARQTTLSIWKRYFSVCPPRLGCCAVYSVQVCQSVSVYLERG